MHREAASRALSEPSLAPSKYSRAAERTSASAAEVVSAGGSADRPVERKLGEPTNSAADEAGERRGGVWRDEWRLETSLLLAGIGLMASRSASAARLK
eukprot:scaffold56961_cov26-Tisochrysis_lutea.AAC.6